MIKNKAKSINERVRKHYLKKKSDGICTRFGCHNKCLVIKRDNRKIRFLKCKKCREIENISRRKGAKR